MVVNSLNSLNAAFLLGGIHALQKSQELIWKLFYVKGNIWNAFRDLVPFVHFKKKPWRTLRRSVTFSTKIHSFMGVFTIFKLYNWYQIGQSITFKRVGWKIYKDYKEHGFRYKTNLAFLVDQISVKKFTIYYLYSRMKKKMKI